MFQAFLPKFREMKGGGGRAGSQVTEKQDGIKGEGLFTPLNPSGGHMASTSILHRTRFVATVLVPPSCSLGRG